MCRFRNRTIATLCVFAWISYLCGCALPPSGNDLTRFEVERYTAIPAIGGSDNVEPADSRNQRRPLATQLASFQDEFPESDRRGQLTDQAPKADSGADLNPPTDDDEVELLPVPPANPASNESIRLADVVASIHSSFPLLDVAFQESAIAAGKQVSAYGGFDTKLKAASENGPVGFYQTYRQSAGLSQPLYHGGEFFGGYRIGRGEFQPWYLERQTNDGGEFKAGISIPLLRNKEIDARRAELWRATYERQRVNPEIQAQLIRFVLDGSIVYWEWVAAGRRYQIGSQALELARKRNGQLERKVMAGAIDPPVLQDNLREFAKREAKLIDLARKLDQSGFKLSLFLRDSDGTPLVPAETQIVSFPEPIGRDAQRLESDIATAIAARPEIAQINAKMQQVNVDWAEANNDLLPEVNAALVGSKDVGGPTSSKRDKSPFELEAGIFVDVPLQRRTARGKLQVANAKMSQLAAKRRFVEEKVRAEVQSIDAAANAAFERIDKARESKRLAEYMAEVERRKFELGESDLLSVVLREQYAIEAAEAEADALLEYFTARAFYNAALSRDMPE